MKMKKVKKIHLIIKIKGGKIVTEAIKVGIISAPERASDLTSRMIEELANDFSSEINNDTKWKVDRIVDSLIGSTTTASEILDRTKDIKEEKEWNFAISVTDLPIFHRGHVVAGNVNQKDGVAQISIPAFGWIPIKQRIKKAIIQLVKELIGDKKFKNISSSQTITRTKDKSGRHKKNGFPVTFIRRYPINENKKNGIDIRYSVHPKINGLIRLFIGMIFANNPLKIISSFKKIIAIAFTTGTFALIFPTVWQLSQVFSNFRLTMIMVAAIIGLVLWIIAAHRLWVFSSVQDKTRIRHLYNLTTTSTLLIDVITYYVILFSLFFITSALLVPTEHFVDTVSDEGKVTIGDYLRVAWVVSSLSTIVSAIGAGLENEELVQDITYGYRQIHRYEKSNR